MLRWTTAYIDPGTGGILLQFILGGIAGLAALVRFRWATIRQRFAGSESAEDEKP